MNITQEQAAERLRAFGIDLLKPHGLRKYYYLEFEMRYRFQLGKTWEEASSNVRKGVGWLVENYKPLPVCDD